MEKTEKTYYKSIDILKGFAIGMVILGHSIIVFPVDLNVIPFWGFLHNLMSSVHMPLFFAVSGFCFSFHGWEDHLKKKFWRIVVPGVFISLIGYLPKAMFPQLVNGGVGSFANTLLSIVNGKSHWFLYTLFAIFLIFPFYYQLLSDPRKRMAILGLLFLNYILVPYPSICCLDDIAHYLPFFTVGYSVKKSKMGKTLFKTLGNISPLYTLASLALWLLTAFVSVVLLKSFPQWIRKFFGVVPAAFGICFWSCFSSRLEEGKFGELIADIGKYSLQLYLFNGYILTVTRTVTVRLLGISTPIVIVAANFCMMYFVSYLITKYIVARVRIFRVFTGIV